MSREKYELRWDILLEYRGLMFGILSLLIVIYHFCEDLMNGGVCPIILMPMAMYGNCGVDAFLILSGIGLYCSYTKDPSIIRFYTKRGLRVVIPYLIIALPYLIWKDVALDFNITSFLKDWFLITAFTKANRQCWFVALIIILYFVFPLIYKIIRLNYGGWVLIGLIILFTVFIKMQFTELFDNVEVALTRVPIFIVGSMMGEACFNKKTETKRDRIAIAYLLPATIIIKIIQILLEKVCGLDVGILERYILGLFGLCICIYIPLLMKRFNIVFPQKINCVILALGGISLELYLSHVEFRRIFHYYFEVDTFSKMLLGYVCIITISFLFSFAVSKLLKRFLYTKHKLSPNKANMEGST